MEASTGVWSRRGYGVSTMPRSVYLLTISVMVLAGIAFAGMVSRVSAEWDLGWNYILLAILVVAVCGFASSFAEKYQRASTSILSFMVITGVIGLLFGPVLHEYAAGTIMLDAFLAAAIIVIAGVVGTVIKDDLRPWGRYLMMALVVFIVGLLGMLLLSMAGVKIIGLLHLWDWVGIALFSLLAVYDFNRAVHVPHTAHNAIDVATQVFLDFANLLINLLGLGSSDD